MASLSHGEWHLHYQKLEQHSYKEWFFTPWFSCSRGSVPAYGFLCLWISPQIKFTSFTFKDHEPASFHCQFVCLWKNSHCCSPIISSKGGGAAEIWCHSSPSPPVPLCLLHRAYFVPLTVFCLTNGVSFLQHNDPGLVVVMVNLVVIFNFQTEFTPFLSSEHQIC